MFILTDKYTAMYIEKAACPDGNDVLLRLKMESLNLVSVHVYWDIYLWKWNKLSILKKRLHFWCKKNIIDKPHINYKNWMHQPDNSLKKKYSIHRYVWNQVKAFNFKLDMLKQKKALALQNSLFHSIIMLYYYIFWCVL